MTTEEYYTPPSDHIFNDIKENAIKIWQAYDDTYGYATEKIDQIKDVQNISDNVWFMVAMFDMPNQHKLLSMVEHETAELIIDALRFNQQ